MEGTVLVLQDLINTTGLPNKDASSLLHLTPIKLCCFRVTEDSDLGLSTGLFSASDL